MAGKTKTIIITSDEDIIQQIVRNKSTNTQIIDLDNIRTYSTNENNEDTFISLALLAKIPESNSNKRSLNSFDQSSSKTMKTSKKPLDMICTICGDVAIGYNYNGLSCGSCKAFFRRNAHHDPMKVRCLLGEDQCSVEYTMSRKCQKCRLKRCLEKGMRKDFLLSEDKIQKRRKRLEEIRNSSAECSTPLEPSQSSIIPENKSNQKTTSPLLDEIDRLMEDIDEISDNIILDENDGLEDILFGTLSVEDWTTIENLKSSFISYFHVPEMPIPNVIDQFNHIPAILLWLKHTDEIALSCINFFRQMSEFEDLPLDDRITLIKYNLFAVFPICKCSKFQDNFDVFSRFPSAVSQKRREIFMSHGMSSTTLDSIINLITSLIETSKRDVTLLSLLLVIIFFTPGLSMSEEEPALKDPLGVNRIQSRYTEILWNYLISQYGEYEAHRRFIGLFHVILRLQPASKNFRAFFRNKCAQLNPVDEITPLMQTVLHLS